MTNKLSLSLTICSFHECKKIMNAISYVHVHCMQQLDAEREYNAQYSFAVVVSNVEIEAMGSSLPNLLLVVSCSSSVEFCGNL